MAIPFQGSSFSDISSGLITGIEVRAQGSGSFISTGEFSDATVQIEPIAYPGEGGTPVVQAIRCACSFTLKQSKATAEIAVMAGTSGTGLYDTDVEIRFTFATGRKITLGAVSGYPMRLTASYDSGGEQDAQQLRCKAENVELYTAVSAKFS